MPGSAPSEEDIRRVAGAMTHLSENQRTALVESALVRNSPEDAFDRIERRSVTKLMSQMTADELPDGRIQLSLPGERALPVFPARALWRLKDVAAMRKCMVGFYESPFGKLSAYESLCKGEFQGAGIDPFAWAGFYANELHAVWSSPDLMLMAADEPFVDMLSAAALSAPTGPLQPDELLAESGVVFFQKERIIPMMSDVSPVRGILWYTYRGFISMQVLIDGHYERDLPGAEGIEPPVENYAYLYVLSLLRTPLARPEAAGEQAVEALGLLRSVSAIARSAHTRSEDRVIEHREKKGGRVRRIHKERVRTLSLHNPEYGRYELDGATGRKLRQHWVRGHWRNQWYASEQTNRTIWIDGFVRGDAALGTVTGQKVYVARGNNQ